MCKRSRWNAATEMGIFMAVAAGDQGEAPTPQGLDSRLRTSQNDDSYLNFLTYCILQLTAAKAAYDERTARASSQPPTPRQPRAGPCRVQRLPAGDEPVPLAA